MAKFQDPYIDVALEPVTIGSSVAESKLGIVVPDGEGGSAQHVVSKDYRLIHNTLAKELSEDIFHRSPYTWSEIKTDFNGKDYRAFYKSNEAIAKMHPARSYGSDSHNIFLGARVRNSYKDGAFGFDFYGVNGHCLNEYHSANLFGSFIVRHSDRSLGNGTNLAIADDFNLQDAISRISVGAESVAQAAPLIQSWDSKPLEVKDIINTKINSGYGSSYWPKVIDQLNNEPGTVFGLYQALTFVATHQVSSVAASVSASTAATNYFVKTYKD